MIKRWGKRDLYESEEGMFPDNDSFQTDSLSLSPKHLQNSTTWTAEERQWESFEGERTVPM